MDPNSPPLRVLFLTSIAVFALAFVVGGTYSLGQLGAPPSISVNPAHLANTLVREGNLTSAVVELESYVAVAPDANDSILTVGILLTDLGRKDEALEAYRRGAAWLPNSAKAHTLLGGAMFVQRRFDDASESFETAVSLNSRYPDAYENLAVSYLNAGRISDAIQIYSTVIEDGDGSASTHDMLSRAYEIAGDRERAFEQAKIAFRMSPSDSSIRAHFDKLTNPSAKKNTVP